MGMDFLPFFMVPLLVYTYFWLNPMAFAAFLEGISKCLVEIYLGYKEWKIEYETKRAYRRHVRASQKLARDSGFSSRAVKLYFETYGEDDWRSLRYRERQRHEKRYRDIEETMRELLPL